MKACDRTPAPIGRRLRAVAVGLCVGLVCCMLLLMLMALLISRVDMPRQAVLPLAIVAAAGGAFVAGLVAGRMAGSRGLLLGAACGAVLFLLILAAGFVRYTAVDGGIVAVKLAALVVAGALGGLLGRGKR